MEFTLLSVGPEQAGALIEIHHDAVHNGMAGRFYPPEILAAWSPGVTPERVSGFRQKMREFKSIGIAASAMGKLAGYGILDPGLARVGALYVRGDAAGQGIGRALLDYLEQAARSLGIERLHLEASKNALAFYARRGWQESGTAGFILTTGCQMDCVRMEKELRSG